MLPVFSPVVSSSLKTDSLPSYVGDHKQAFENLISTSKSLVSAMSLPTKSSSTGWVGNLICGDTNDVEPNTPRGVFDSSGNSETETSTSSTTEPGTCAWKKPFLSFSIDRILGLGPYSERLSPKTQQHCPHDNGGTDSQEHKEDYEENEDKMIEVDDVNLRHLPQQTSNDFSYCGADAEAPKFQWLQCTRYHPPKVQRSKKKEGCKKRKLGRNQRVPFTQHQVVVLGEKFRRTHYLSSMDVLELSAALSLTETRVKVWFQNRRARERRDKEILQRKQASLVQRAFQPLSIPTVTWPMTPGTSGNYVQYQHNLEFPPSGGGSSPFAMYSREVTGEDVRRDMPSESNPRDILNYQ